jgi:hypothetical protein
LPPSTRRLLVGTTMGPDDPRSLSCEFNVPKFEGVNESTGPSVGDSLRRVSPQLLVPSNSPLPVE